MTVQTQLILLALCGYLFIILQFLHFQKKNQIELEQKLKKEWGTFSKKELSPSDWAQLTQSYLEDTSSYSIDAITWNDLDLNTIFLQLNHTHSSIGEEYLYHLLHTPVTKKEQLEERERLITFFASHEKERLSFELLAESIGKQRNFSLRKELLQVEEIPKLSSAKHLAALILLIGSLFLLLASPILGIFAFICVLAYGISLYYKEKANTAKYISFFQQIVLLLKAVDKQKECSAPELKPYLDQMAAAQKSLYPFKMLCSWILSRAPSGSPIDLLLDYVRMFTHIDFILFNRIAEQLQTHKSEVALCMEQFGFLESMIAAASYRQALPASCQPVFLPIGKEKCSLSIELKEVYHPAITAPIKNSINTTKSVLLTGSNASGKSTFLKTTAIAALLAQTIHTVPAEKYQAPFYQIYSSMAIQDNLSGHDSYYMAEIKSLKRILDAKKDAVPVLCFIDEVLRGTNTIERIAAAAEILESLSNQRVLCFAATHDIELTQLLSGNYENYHFSEQIQNDDILFDYKLKKGISTTRNAIRLLQQIGYDNTIISRALLRADTFLKTGNWRKDVR